MLSRQKESLGASIAFWRAFSKDIKANSLLDSNEEDKGTQSRSLSALQQNKTIPLPCPHRHRHCQVCRQVANCLLYITPAGTQEAKSDREILQESQGSCSTLARMLAKASRTLPMKKQQNSHCDPKKSVLSIWGLFNTGYKVIPLGSLG